MIRYHSEDTDFIFKNKRNNSKWLKFVVETDKNDRVGEVNIIFCSDNYLLEINKKYLNHDYYTDVITFQYNSEDFASDRTLCGDIFISIDTVKDNAEQYSLGDFDVELRRVMLHGILHLIGYGDATEEEQVRMRERENYYLERYNNQ